MKRLALIVLAGLAFGATAAYATSNGKASTPRHAVHAHRHHRPAVRAFQTAPEQAATAGPGDEAPSSSQQDTGSGSGDETAPAPGGGDEQGDDSGDQGDQSEQEDGQGDQQDTGGQSHSGDGANIGGGTGGG